MDLMDALTEAAGCRYLSDLRYVVLGPGQEARIRALSETEFTASQYREAAVYLGGCPGPEKDIAALKETILNCMKRHR